jgi:hypothetical protein
MNLTAFGTNVRNGSMTHFIDLIFYTEASVRGILLDLATLYFKCFNNYSNNLMFKKKLLMDSVLGVTVLGCFLFAILILYVIREQDYMKDIAQLVKTDSYINDNIQIADK